MTDGRSAWALALAAATGIQVGAAVVVSRAIVAEVGTVPLALFRYAFGAAFLIPFALRSGGAIPRPDRAPIALLGILQFAVVMVLLNYALERIPSARAALLFATTPLLTLLLESARDRRLGLARLVAVLLTIAGVGAVLNEQPLDASGDARGWIGDLCALASALCAALCVMLYRPYLRRNPPVLVGAAAMLASVVALAVIAAVIGLPALSAFGTRTWLAVAFVGVSSGVGYWLWLKALVGAPATEVTMFLALSPLTAAALGNLLLGESLTANLALGVVLVIFGLSLGLRPLRR